MTREEADFIGGMNMCDEISNEAYRKIMCHCEEQEPCEDCISREHLLEGIASLKESPWFKDDTNCAMAIRKEAIEIVEDLCIRKEPSVNSQEPCEDAVSRQAVINLLENTNNGWIIDKVLRLPSVNPQKIGHCKDCKYFEYDSVAKVGGIPLIVAHEICNKWGDGCKTSEEGFCFLFEPQESEE